jgi:hypothetical protein
MTRTERNDLAKLCRQRERLAKAAADARAAEMRADFQRKLAAVFSFDDHVVWQKAYAGAKAAVEKAQAEIETTLSGLGIHRSFGPQMNLSWWGRGENASKERRAELTKVAYSRIEAQTKQAKHSIEAASVEIQTRLVADSLESEDARRFLESMPAAADLMPLLTTPEIRELAGPDDADDDDDAEL